MNLYRIIPRLRAVRSGFKPLFSLANKPAFSSAVYLERKNYQNDSRSYFKGEIFLYCGVMSLFGLQKEDAEKEDELIMTLKRSVLLMQAKYLKLISHYVIETKKCQFYRGETYQKQNRCFTWHCGWLRRGCL
jgi:hypothetical protein